MLDRALQRDVALADLREAHSRNLGRAGSAAAAGLLRSACDRAASEAERVAIALLREAGVDGWKRGYRVESYEIDLAFPASRVAIEVDGWAWHSDVERFRHDRQRQNALVLAGWTVLRFTWHDLINRRVQVIAEIRGVLGVRPAAITSPEAPSTRAPPVGRVGGGRRWGARRRGRRRGVLRRWRRVAGG